MEIRPRARRAPRAPAVVMALVLGATTSGCSARASGLEADLRATGLTLYLPQLEGRLPVTAVDAAEPGVTDMDPAPPSTGPAPREQARPTSVEVDDRTVVVTYTRDGAPAYELREQAVPQGSLCRAVAQIAGSECTENGGTMRSVMEEMATVAVVRGETLLVLAGLVRESHPDLVDVAVTVLEHAPAVSDETLSTLAAD